MSPVAFCFGRLIVYWDSVLIALAVPACFLAIAGFYATCRGNRTALFVLTPLGTLLSLVVSRLMYWSCHQEQFLSLFASFAPGSGGGYCLSGVLIGFLLAVLVLRLLRLATDTALLLDCSAPGLALGLSILRLSSLFNDSCRGKVVLKDPRFFSLPFGAVSPGGAAEYRFASFFVGALLFLLLFFLTSALLLRPERRRSPAARQGDIFLVFLLLYAAIEMVVDSTRYDATFFTFNAFISVAQILSAVAILLVLLVFSVRSVRRVGLRAAHWLCWSCWLLGLSGVGVCEFLVQRQGNRQLLFYSLMSLSTLVVVGSVLALRRAPCEQ